MTEPQEFVTPLIQERNFNEENNLPSIRQIQKAYFCIRLGLAFALIIIITAGAFSILVYYYHSSVDKKLQTTNFIQTVNRDKPQLNLVYSHNFHG